MSLNLKNDIALCEFTTLRVGGPARYFVSVTTENELEEAISWAKGNNQSVFVLGGGSNVVISDQGFKGLVISIDIKGRDYKEIDNGQVLATIKAGEVWDDFVKETVDKNLAGVECMSGIPGKVGASVVGNIGAYGQETSEVVDKVRFYDLSQKKFVTYTNKQCKLSYRESVFKESEDRIVTSVTFKLRYGGEPCLKYKELSQLFVDQKPDLSQVREAVLKLRASKSMLLDKNDPNSVSAGSFFKNPIVAKSPFDNIQEKYREAPSWPQPDGSVKLSAGWLIEKSGFSRGYTYKNGSVGLSQKHALAIVNLGGASASDIAEFSRIIQ